MKKQRYLFLLCFIGALFIYFKGISLFIHTFFVVDVTGHVVTLFIIIPLVLICATLTAQLLTEYFLRRG